MNLVDCSYFPWYGIFAPLVVIKILAGLVLVVLQKTVKRDLTTGYQNLDIEAQSSDTMESGWKLLKADVFRPPSNPSLLCIMVGDGVQILGMTVVTILLTGLGGFMSPAYRTTLIICMLLFYMILGIPAGYIAVHLWSTIFCGDHKGWVSLSWKVACFFPGITFLILFILNSLMWCSDSTRAIPFSLFIIFLLFWLCISVPLTLVGGYFGTKASHIKYPFQTNQIPRKIPDLKYLSWLLVLGAGIFPFVPFATVFIGIFFTMSGISMCHVYYGFIFLFLGMIVLVLVSAGTSIVLTHMHLCSEDYKWWWKSFFASGFAALYIFLFLIHNSVSDLKSLSGPLSVTLDVGGSLIMVIAVMLATGTVGFLSSFWFVHYLFSTMKLD